MGLPDVSPSTVLVADDDSLVRMSLRFALESRGLRVVEVDDSVQLISNVVIERPVLCIIDVNMPGPSVVDRISAIREVSPSTAVLVISGEVIAPAAL
ncbi:MAG: response regulator, partial [Salinibacterium sp.]|nr:response regulator [Salinibacterium sp.]